MTKTKPTCKDCVHFNTNMCLRFPPQVYYDSDAMNSDSRYPTVGVDWWACGEFKPKKKEKKNETNTD